MVVSQIIMQKTSGQEMQGSMKYMPWITSAMFLFIGFTVPIGFSLYYTVSNVLMVIESLVAKKIYDPEKMKAQLDAEIEEKKKAKKAKKTVVVKTDDGEAVKKEVSETELASLRLQRARELDAARYADERTVPLTAEERAAADAAAAAEKKTGLFGKKKAAAADETTAETEKQLEAEKAAGEKEHRDEQ